MSCCYRMYSFLSSKLSRVISEYEDIKEVDEVEIKEDEVEVDEIILPNISVRGRFICITDDSIQVVLHYKNVLVEMYVILFDVSIKTIKLELVEKINKEYGMYPIDLKWMDIYCNRSNKSSLYNRMCKITILLGEDRILNMSELLCTVDKVDKVDKK